MYIFQKALLRLTNSKANYEDVEDEIYRLRELKQSALVESAERDGKRLRIIEKDEFLDEQPEVLEEYDAQLAKR